MSWEEVEKAAREIGNYNMKITDDGRIELVSMASGDYKPKINGTIQEPENLTTEDLNTIRECVGLEAVVDFDTNPLIPGDALEDKQIAEKKRRDKEKKKDPYDENPLIPDDYSPRPPAKKRESENEYDTNPLIPD